MSDLRPKKKGFSKVFKTQRGTEKTDLPGESSSSNIKRVGSSGILHNSDSLKRTMSTRKNPDGLTEEELKETFHEIKKTEKILLLCSCRLNSKPIKLGLTDVALYIIYSGDEKECIPLKRVLALNEKTISRLFSETYQIDLFIANLGHCTLSHFHDKTETSSAFSAAYTPFLRNSSVLHAIEREDIERIQYLMQYQKELNIDITYEPDSELLPLHQAICSKNVQIVELYLEYYQKNNLDINVKDNNGWTIMHVAVYYSTGKTAEDEILKELLLLNNVQVDVDNNDSNTPLHYFCERFISPSCEELGTKLIERGGNVNKRNKNGETPIHKAIFNRAVRILMVELLLKNGADVNATNTRFGETALHYAVRLGRKDLMKVLIDHGADVNKTTKEGKTPYELAETMNNIDIAAPIKRVLDLQTWLKENQLEKLLPLFIREELYLDLLCTLDEETTNGIINSVFSSETAGSKMRIKRALQSLRESITNGEKDLLEKFKRVEKMKKENQAIAPNPQISPEAILGSQIDNSWLLKESDLEFTKAIGKGTYGKVYKGIYQGTKVAIKVIKAQDDEVFQEFSKEFQVMSVLKSPHVIKFYGGCLEPKVCIVMEYAKRGTLFHVLSDKKLVIDWDKGFKFMIETVAGMSYLHTCKPPVFHRDMKSLNILVTKDWEVKITDFGLSRVIESDRMQTLGKMVGTIGWTAPELMFGENFTAKSDVYSVGIIIWEILHRLLAGTYQTPYKEFNFQMDVQIIMAAAEKKLRPTIPTNCPPPLTDLVQKMWNPLPEERPNFIDLLPNFKSVHETYLSEKEKWISLLPQQGNNVSAN